MRFFFRFVSTPQPLLYFVLVAVPFFTTVLDCVCEVNKKAENLNKRRYTFWRIIFLIKKNCCNKLNVCLTRYVEAAKKNKQDLQLNSLLLFTRELQRSPRSDLISCSLSPFSRSCFMHNKTSLDGVKN